VTEQVAIENRSLAVIRMGEGNPTVVLEAGLGFDATIWSNIQPEIATFCEVCAYSRAGIGDSPSATGKRDIQNIVNDLETLLENDSMEGPFILVGHSIGGLIINMYAYQHPQQVAGLVFVDSSHPNQDNELPQALPEDLRAAKIARSLNSKPPENWFSSATATQGETAYMQPGSLGHRPVAVLTADTSIVHPEEITWAKENLGTNYTKDIAMAEKAVWKTLQGQYAQLSSNTQHLDVKGSFHFIHLDKPEVVVEAIQQVVQSVRTGEPLTPMEQSL